MAYEFIQDSPITKGHILNAEKNEIICLVDTKRPDLNFDSLKKIIEKANMYDDLCR